MEDILSLDKENTKLKLSRDRPYCGICKQPLTIKEIWSAQVNIDHIKSRHDGGTNSYQNLQLAHKECNKIKGSHSNREFL